MNSGYIETTMITVLAALLGMSLPLFMQIVQRMEEKYHSSIISQSFRQEKCYKTYRWMVWTCMAIILYTPFAPECCYILKDYYIISHSAHLLAWLGLLVGLFALFLTGRMITIYERPDALINHIATKSEDIYKDNHKFSAFADLYKFSMFSGNTELYLKCSSLFGECVGLCRKGKEEEPVIYPSYVYDLINSSLRICQRYYGDLLYPALNNPQTVLTAYFDDFGKTVLSHETFVNLWQNMIQLYSSRKDEWIKGYWVYADQLASYTLQDRARAYKAKDIYIEEFHRFTEFHHVLSAYFLYMGNRSLVDWTFRFSNSSLERMPLVAKNIGEVISHSILYMPYNGLHIETRYTFYADEGIKTGAFIQKWILRYYIYSLLRHGELWKQNPYGNNPWKSDVSTQDLKKLKSDYNTISLVISATDSDRQYFKDLQICVETIGEFLDSLELIRKDIEKQIDTVVSKTAVENSDLQNAERLIRESLALNIDNIPHGLGGPAKDICSFEAYVSTDKSNVAFVTHKFCTDSAPALSYAIYRQICEKYSRILFYGNNLTTYDIEYSEIQEAFGKLKLNDKYAILPIGVNINPVNNGSFENSLPGNVPSILVIKKNSLPLVEITGNCSLTKYESGNDIVIKSTCKTEYKYSLNVDVILLRIINQLFDGKISQLPSIQPI